MALELLTLLGFLVLIEGVLLALFPAALRRMMAEFALMEAGRLRSLGLVAAVLAVVFLALVVHLGGDGQGDALAFGFPRLRGFMANLL